MTNKIKTYEKILKLVTEEISEDRIELSKSTLETVIENLKVSERFGIPLKHITQWRWLNVKKGYDDWTGIGLYGAEHKRTIGCSDDRTQPDNEWLFAIRFTTGAYIFGESYPVNTFKAFWEELKSYNPAFCDTANSSLYFRDDVAKVVYDNFWGIFNKHRALVQDELKEQQKQKLRDELARLEIE